jgi:hypothetical protein
MAAMLVIVALYHTAGLTIPAFAKIAYPATYPPLRHVAFILIDAAFGYLFLIRPWWLIWPSLILTAQVLNSHGGHATQVWRRSHQINWADPAAIAITLYGLTILYLDRRSSPNLKPPRP